MTSDLPEYSADDVPSFQEIVENELEREAVQGAKPDTRPPGMAEQVIISLLPQYERWEFLGAGGMGVVYKAWHRELMRWAAIKVLSPDQVGDPRAMARFQNEASLLAQLRHPSIVPIHDFGSKGELAWLVMDFVDGVPLQTWAAEEKRKPADVARMVAKIARAVGVAHAAGITHRDLKPANILVRGAEPVLLDFGLAQDQAWQKDVRLTQMGELAGTVAYLAPEQVQPSLGDATPSTDVHACGVILFELLAGRLPRTGLASEIIARLHQDDQPPRLSTFVKSVRPELSAICWRALQRKPEDRYANGTSLAEDLQRFLDGRPVRARNPDILDTAVSFIRRYPWAVAAMLVATMALSVTGWAGTRMLWSQRKSKLLTEINQQFAENDWNPERLARMEALLEEMHEVDTVVERYLRQGVVKRTHTALLSLLDAPRLSDQESDSVGTLLHYLKELQHPDGERLQERWESRAVTWQPLVTLKAPISRETTAKVFRANGWDVRKGRLAAVPARPDQTWGTLYSRMTLSGPVELEAEFDETWQEAKGFGVNLAIPWLKDVRFNILQADRFAPYRMPLDNPEKAPVMVILSGNTPLAYAIVPKEVRQNPHLILRCRYENGELAFSVNDQEPLRYTAVFGLSRPLLDAHFSVLLPVEATLSRLVIRTRRSDAGLTPFSAADDLVSAGRFSEALEIYEKYLNRADIRSECLFKYATCLEGIKKPKEAVRHWEMAARTDDEPWKSLSLYQLWRGHLAQGNLESANAWFDLLLAGHPPDLVRTGMPMEERVLLGQYYVPAAQSLNCLKARPEDMAGIERAVRVQQFIGTDMRDTAANTALAFHFIGQDQHAREILTQAVGSVRASARLSGPDIFRTMICLDHWCALGEADNDRNLQTALKDWNEALKATAMPIAAVLRLEKVRHDLRSEPKLNARHLSMLRELTSNPSVLLRYRLEAALMMDLGHHQSGRGKAELQAALAPLILDADEGMPDPSLQRFYTEFIVRSESQSWTTNRAVEWLTAVLGKARPMVSRERWVGPTVQSLTGESLARALNQALLGERGQRFAQDYILRSKPARELAHEGMRLVLESVFSEGAGLPLIDYLAQDSATRVVDAFCAGEFGEVELMQFFLLWSGVKTEATWNMLAEEWSPELRKPLSRLLVRRYQMLGKGQESDSFLADPGHEKPAPKTTRVDDDQDANQAAGN